MTPEDALTERLVEYLESDSELMGLTNGLVAPEAVWGTNASPFVRIDRLDGADVVVVGLERVWVDTSWHIRGVLHWRGGGRPDRTEVNAIGGRIDELLHDHEELTSTIRWWSYREEPTPTPATTEGGELWLQSGGIYRLRVQAV